MRFIKKFFIIFFIFLISISKAQNIRGGIKYNETAARIEAFKDMQRKIGKEEYKSYLKDPNYKENMENIKNSIFTIKNERFLCPFYAKNTLVMYCVTYIDNLKYTFYYNIFGNLAKFDMEPQIQDNNSLEKIYSYSKYGNLISIAVTVNEEEQFIYNKDGKLIAHWEGENLTKKPNMLKFIDITRGKNEKTE